MPFAGAGETLKAFLGDHIDIYAGSISPILPYVKDKSAKCLMVTSAERNPVVPDAAGLTDLGVPSESTVLWRGIIAPKTMPADRLAVLQKAFAEAAQSPKFKEFMQKRGEEAKGSSAAEFRKLIDTEYDAMGKVMASIGLDQEMSSERDRGRIGAVTTTLTRLEIAVAISLLLLGAFARGRRCGCRSEPPRCPGRAWCRWRSAFCSAVLGGADRLED